MSFNKVTREELGSISLAFKLFGHGREPLVMIVQVSAADGPDPAGSDMITTFHPAYTAPENKAKLIALVQELILQLQELLDGEERKH